MTWSAAASAVSAASPQAVWAVLLDGRRWSLWNPGVEWLWLEGDPAPGTLATLKLRGVRQTALVLEAAAAPQRFALRLTVGPVARLAMSWTLSPLAGGTRIDAEVHTTGIAEQLLLRRPARRVGAALPAHLERLAAYASAATLQDLS